ncbi:hypothetical protein C0995_003088 [Termitomyces sp. Mi166|nr:hypothetical protein C0995_003088 [Termitomyces sp. Mi166\
MDGLIIQSAPANSYEEDGPADPITALIMACCDKNIAGIENIIQKNMDNPEHGLNETFRLCIARCAQGGKENAEIFVALMKYPHLPLSSSIGSDEFISRVVYSGDLEIFEAMLTIGWNPCSPLKHLGDTLTYAVKKDKLPVVSWLLDHGAKYDANEAGQPFSILARAAQFASPAVVECLLAAGAPIKNSRALEMAVFDGRIDTVACLLDHGGDIDEIASGTSTWIRNDKEAAKDGYGTALHTAAKRGHLKAVHFLIDRGANVEVRDTKGRTALELAMTEKHSDIMPNGISIIGIVESTLAELARIASPTMDEPIVGLAPHGNMMAALTKAFRNNNIAEVEYIIQANRDKPHLHGTVLSCIMQCARGGKENAELLVVLMKYPHVSLDISVETDKFVGRAISSGDLEIFQAMLTVGWGSIFVGDALMFAVMRDRLTVVSWLLDHGAKYDANEGWQPFSILATAARFASTAVIERLLALLDVYDGRIDSAACLLDNGADINEIAAENSTWVRYDKDAVEDGYGAALHVAARQEHLKAVQFLIDRGADVELGDSKGRTALDLAIMEKHSAIINFELLLSLLPQKAPSPCHFILRVTFSPIHLLLFFPIPGAQCGAYAQPQLFRWVVVTAILSHAALVTPAMGAPTSERRELTQRGHYDN